jgi:8-oxo-dGTP pyrophosphatase MutT (NUDIX family)
MTLSIDVTVAAIVERNGRFLMVEEETAQGVVFNQPAGHLEAGESLIEAVVRETLEETGYDFVPEALLGFYRWARPATPVTFLRVAFFGSAKDPAGLVTLDEGILATHWLTRDQLIAQPGRLRSPMVTRCINDYLGGQRLELDCLVDVPGREPQRATS